MSFKTIYEKLKVLSAEELADMHKVSVKDIEKQLKMGAEVELEHTDDKAEALKIAKQHVYEDPKYYTKLKKCVEGQEMKFNELLAEAIKVSDAEMKQLESMGFNFSDEWSGSCADVYINNTSDIKVSIEKCKSKFPINVEVDSYNKLYKSIADKDKNEYEARVGFKSLKDAIKFVK